MDVFDIVKKWLMASEYDGLFSSDMGCGCTTDDLAPCGDMGLDCEAGYYQKGCDGGCDHGGCDFHIVRDKPAPPSAEGE